VPRFISSCSDIRHTPAHRLRGLAHEVERLATIGRFDPEMILEAKAELARRMRELARELEPARCGR
jgi:hypothetical protein